ncbi:MAG: LysR substrate-binding domain-containing protein [Pseudomonadota bacterium]
MPEDKFILPPFRALLAFWAAARADRLADAAEQLSVTESAISHQLRRLEEFLNTRLFERVSGRLNLTPTGQRYLEQIEPAMRDIHAATAALLPSDGRQVARLTLPPSLAATWLIPRLGRFETAQPEIDVQMVLTTRLLDMQRDQIDVAIRYGRGSWPDVDAAFLFEDLATPVCAPGLLPEGADPGALPEGLRYIINRSIPVEWEEWARANGLNPPPPEAMLTLETIEQVLQVAEAGHGLAMGRSPYIEPRLERGSLVAPFGEAGPTGASYFVCLSRGRAPTAAARKLARWLEAEGKAYLAEVASEDHT